MDKLPPEILQNIFILLPLGERVKCLRVCRAWWNVLDRHCLLYDVEIQSNVDRFTTFMNLMEQSPRHAAQVQTLNLVSTLPSDFNKRRLCSVFPNARVLEVKHDYRATSHTTEYFVEPLAITHSKPKIRSLVDEGFCELASQMLYSKLCGRLEKLELNFLFTNTSSRTILDQLKDLPVLRVLRLDRLKMGIDDLEALHNNLLTIQVFMLGCIHVSASRLPYNIVPLLPIKLFRFIIAGVDNIETHIAIYKYMTRKYVNAINGSCLDSPMNQYSSSDAMLIYDSAVFDYLRLVAPMSSHFMLSSVPNGINVFKVFDDMKCQFEKLSAGFCKSDSFIQDLIQSKQSKCIRDLCLMNTPVNPPDILKQFPALTTFRLTVLNNNDFSAFVNITDFLNSLPKTVTKFSVDSPLITCVPINTNVSLIKKLQIICNYNITRALGEVISTCFPRLVELKLSGKVLKDTSIVLNIDSLKNVTFHNLKSKYGFSFRSARQYEPQHYLCDGNQITLSTYEDIKQLPTLSFTWFKKNRLDISDGIKIVSL